MPWPIKSDGLLTASRLRELLDYDPETGVFTWRVTRAPHFRPGDIAGYIDPNGYRVIGVDVRTQGSPSCMA